METFFIRIKVKFEFLLKCGILSDPWAFTLDVSMNVIVWNKCQYVVRTCWYWAWRVGGFGDSHSRSNHTSLPCECRALGVRQPWMLKNDWGCIDSSGNVRKCRLARGLSWWNMGKLVFSEEWQIYVKSLQLPMWSSFKVSFLGYMNQFIHSFE